MGLAGDRSCRLCLPSASPGVPAIGINLMSQHDGSRR